MKYIKAALYLRTSTAHQSSGIDSQERALMSFIKLKNISDFVVFKDEGQSGAKQSRPALDEMLSRVRNGEFSIVCCFSFSRFARSTRQLLEALTEFNNLGVEFISLSESIDTSTSMGRLVFSFIAALSQFERELIAERVSNGLRAAKARGKVLGRPKTRNSELIRELYSQGLSYRKIANLAKCSLWSVGDEIKQLRLENSLSIRLGEK